MKAMPPGAGAGGLEGFCSFSGVDEELVDAELPDEVDVADEADESELSDWVVPEAEVEADSDVDLFDSL
jgi:hypothetical protein